MEARLFALHHAHRGKQGLVWTRPLSSQSRTSMASNTHGGSFLRPCRTDRRLYRSLAARPLWRHHSRCRWSAIPGSKTPRPGLGPLGADAALPPTSTDTRRCGSEPSPQGEGEAERAGELQAGAGAEGRWGREWAARSTRTEAGPASWIQEFSGSCLGCKANGILASEHAEAFPASVPEPLQPERPRAGAGHGQLVPSPSRSRLRRARGRQPHTGQRQSSASSDGSLSLFCRNPHAPTRQQGRLGL